MDDKKEPLTTEMLKKILEQDGQEGDARLIASISVTGQELGNKIREAQIRVPTKKELWKPKGFMDWANMYFAAFVCLHSLFSGIWFVSVFMGVFIFQCRLVEAQQRLLKYNNEILKAIFGEQVPPRP